MSVNTDRPHNGRAPRDERRPHIEARLFEAVDRLCGPGGTPFSELPVARLAEHAGIARATFYLYFPDRTAFALRLTEHARSLLAPAFGVLWHAAAVDRASLDGALLDLVMTFRDAQGLMSAPVEAGLTDAVIQAQVDAQRDVLVDETTRALAAARRRGRLRPDLPVRETAEVLILMIEHGLYTLVRGSEPRRAREIAAALSSVCWHALYPDAR